MAYMNVEEIEAALDALAGAYPNSAELIALPNATTEGRRSHALRIGPATRSAFVIIGGLHAREWVPPDALIYFAADLLESYAGNTGLRYGGQRFTAGDIRTLVEEICLVIFPCVNPDGRQHSQNVNAMWRKNRRKVSSLSGSNCIGVDLNRNFDALWDFRRHFATSSGVSASVDPCDPQVYVGPSAASEPETRNVVWLLDRFPEARWFIDVHSYVPAIYHSWGFDENQTSDPDMCFQNPTFDGQRGREGDVYREFIPSQDLEEMQELAGAMNTAIGSVAGARYELGQSFALYPTSGTSDDYVYARHFVDNNRKRILSFTVECGRSFQPSWEEAQGVIRELCAGLIAFGLATQRRAAPPVVTASSS